VNRLNEVIYALIWFLLVIRIIVAITSLIQWLLILYYRKGDAQFIAKKINKTYKEVMTFTNDYLQRDVLFLLRFISHNMGSALSTEIVEELWKTYDNKVHEI
jgi:hypothetical protein